MTQASGGPAKKTTKWDSPLKLAGAVPPELAGLTLVAFVALASWKLNQTGVLIVVSIIAIVTVIYVRYQQSRLRTTTEQATFAQEAMEHFKQSLRWKRDVLLLPLPAEPVDIRHALVKKTAAIRDRAVLQLQTLGQEISPDQVRANIFLPDYVGATEADVCTLKMLGPIQIGMDGHPDVDVTFRPGQGAVGRVFVEERSHIAIVSEEGAGDGWADIYELTSAQKEEIHPDLRWLCSFPLMVTNRNGERRTAAILNVDCLNHVVERGVLEDFAARILPDIQDLTETLETAPTVSLFVGYEQEAA